MKVLLDARYLDGRFSGIGMYSEQLIRHMARLAPETIFECFVQPAFQPLGDLPGNVRLLPVAARPLSFTTVFTLQKLIHERKPDLFHALFPVTPVFHRGPMVVTVHDLQPLQMKGWSGGRAWAVERAYDAFYHWMYPNTFRRARALIAVSQATGTAVAALGAGLESKTSVIHSGMAPEAREQADPLVLADLKLRHGLPDPYLLYIGSTRPNKNLENMLKAFAELKRTDPQRYQDLRFVLVLSPGRFLRQIRQTIHHLGISSCIHLFNPINHKEKNALIQGARLLFFATKYEGFGFPLLEAQAQGTPVLISDRDALPEIAGDSALSVNPDDPQAMAQALARLMEDVALREEMIRRGHRNLERFSWQTAAQATLDVYERVCR